MNLKHGFYSKNIELNPDARLLGCASICLDDLCLAESFLHGDSTTDPLYAHQVVKQVYSAGRLRYPTLWDRANKYVNGYEFSTMEKILSLKNK